MGLTRVKKTVQTVQRYSYYFLRRCSPIGLIWSLPLPDSQFVIFAAGRSGSTLLVNLLNCSAQIYCDDEILNRQRVLFPRLLIDTYVCNSSKPAYGFKLLAYQLTSIHRKEPETFLQNLHQDGFKIIYLTRRNILNHALSQINAVQKNKFHYQAGEYKPTYQPIHVDVDEVIEKMAMSDAQTQHYDDIFSRVPHLKLTYECNLEQSATHQATANRVMDYLDLPHTPVMAGLMKLMPADLSDMVENHEELVHAIRQTQYSHYLNFGMLMS